MLMNKFNFILLGGIALVWSVSWYAESLIRRNSYALDPATRDRVLSRADKSEWFWRAPQFIGFVLMLASFLSNWGLVRITRYPFSMLAIGLAIYCASNILRTWLVQRAYSGEAPGTPASRSAFSAALMVSCAELGLATSIGWYVMANVKSPPAKQPKPPATQNSTADENTPSTKAKKLWGDAVDALALLPGKEEWYFEALVKREKIRTKRQGVQTLYHLDDLEKTVDAGLPTVEDMREYVAAGN